MRMRIALAGMAATLAVAALPAMAADPRIRDIDYDANTVVRLEGCSGFQTMVEFGPAERIENVGLGDAARWLVVPNKRANMLFVKPAYATSRSNMTVSTDHHRYNFELVANASEACRRGAVVYSLRFRYPADESVPVVATDIDAKAADAPAADDIPTPEQRNSAYTFTGAPDNIPQRVFDNGHSTWFHWAEGIATPAVYAVGADKSETLVGFSSRGDYLVVDQVAPAYVLRRGNAAAVLYNDAYQVPALDAGSPQPRIATKNPPRRGLARLFRPKEAQDAH